MMRRLAFSLSGLALSFAVLTGCGDVSHPVQSNGSTTLLANSQEIDAARSISFLVDGNTNAKDLKSFILAQVQNSANPQIDYQVRQIDTTSTPADGQYYKPRAIGSTPEDPISNKDTIYYTSTADVYADLNFPNTGNASDLNAVQNYPEAKTYSTTFATVAGYSNKHVATPAYTGYGLDNFSAFGDFNPRTVVYTPPSKIFEDKKTPGKPLDTFLLYVIPQDPAFAAFGIRIHLDLNVVITPGTPAILAANTAEQPTKNTVQFQATVPGDGMNQGVTWKSELMMPDGSFSPDTPSHLVANGSPALAATFTAPIVSSNATYRITATSVTQPDKTATTTITVNGAGTTIGFRAAAKPSHTR